MAIYLQIKEHRTETVTITPTSPTSPLMIRHKKKFHADPDIIKSMQIKVQTKRTPL